MPEKKPEIKRGKLIITQVDEPKQIKGGATKLAFKAANPEGDELPYYTFRKSLFDFFKPNTEIDAEWTESERKWEGNVFIDRKVDQLYDKEGKALSSSSGKKYSDSGETMAARIVADFILADKLEKTDADLKKGLGKWLRSKLLKTETVKSESESEPNPKPKPKPEPEPKTTNPKLLTPDLFWQRITALGYTRESVVEHVSEDWNIECPEDIDGMTAEVNPHNPRILYDMYVHLKGLIEQ